MGRFCLSTIWMRRPSGEMSSSSWSLKGSSAWLLSMASRSSCSSDSSCFFSASRAILRAVSSVTVGTFFARPSSGTSMVLGASMAPPMLMTAVLAPPGWALPVLRRRRTMMIGRFLSSAMAAPLSDRRLLAAQFLFQILEIGAHAAEQQLAREFHGDWRRIAAHARHERHLHHLEGLALLAGLVLQGRRDRTDEAISHQDAEEGADQCRAHLVADLGRAGTLDGGHGADDAEHRRHDAET